METDRRGWLAAFGKLVTAGCAVGATLLTGRFLMPAPTRDLSRRKVLGRLEALPTGTSTYLSDSNVHVMHQASGLFAVSARCTHLGCIVKKVPEGFECPCHGARFDLHGEPQSGPATRPLRWLRITIDRKKNVVLHLDQTVKAGTMAKV